MKSILEEIYFASGGPVETIREGEQYNKLNNKYNEMLDRLSEELGEEQKETINKLADLVGGLELETALTHFKEGFKLCMRFILENISK